MRRFESCRGHGCDVARHRKPLNLWFGGFLYGFGVGLVVACRVEGEVAEEFSGGGIDDADVEVFDEHDDGGSGVGSSDADVVKSSGVAEGDAAGASSTNTTTCSSAPLRGVGSAGAVDVSAVLDAVDQNDLVIRENLVDDAVIAATGGMQAFEFANQRLAEPLRVLGDCLNDRRQRSLSNLWWEQVQVPETLRRDLNLVHVRASDVVPEL